MTGFAWRGPQRFNPTGPKPKETPTLEELFSRRQITAAQHRAAQNCSDPKRTDEGDLWVTTSSGMRQLISRNGSIAMEYRK